MKKKEKKVVKKLAECVGSMCYDPDTKVLTFDIDEDKCSEEDIGVILKAAARKVQVDFQVKEDEDNDES